MSLDSSTRWNLDEYRHLQLPHPDHPEDGHTGVVYGLHLQDDHLVSVSADKTARIWDLRTQRLLHPPLVGHTGSVTAVQFDAANDVIITGDTNGNVIVWRFSTGEAIKTIAKAHHETVLSIHLDGRYFVTGGRDGKIKLWNRHSLNVNNPDVPEFAVKPAEGDRYEEYSLLATFEGYLTAPVNSLKLKDKILVSGSGDSTMCIWSLQTGQILHKVNIHQQGIVCLQYNGRFVVSGSSDNSVRIYDVEQKEEVACLRGHTGLIRSIQAVFDYDGEEVKTVISGSYDGTVRVWEPVSDSREWQTQYQFHLGNFHEAYGDSRADNQANRRIFSIALDANWFVCAGQGPIIRFWDLRSPSK